MTTIKAGLMAVCLLMFVVVICVLLFCGVVCADVKHPYITTDKSDYKCGEIVVITYDFGNSLVEKETILRISIYQDPEFILHVVTWDAGSVNGMQYWKTTGLWDGTYYIVAKYHRPVGLLYNEEVVAVSKFTLASGAKQQQSLLSMIEQVRMDGLNNHLELTPAVYAVQKAGVTAWFASVC